MIRLKDILTKLLLEIGDSAPYSAQISSEQGDIYNPKQAGDNFLQYKFTTDKGAEYEVNIDGISYGEKGSLQYYIDVDFIVDSDSEYKLTGEGKPMKIMATVTNILKKVLEGDANKNIKGISYSAMDKKRDNMYRTFITIATKGKAEFEEVDGKTIATFTDR